MNKKELELKISLKEHKARLDIAIEDSLIHSAKKTDGTPNTPKDYKNISRFTWLLALSFLNQKANEAFDKKEKEAHGNLRMAELAIINHILNTFLN